jgi:saxitoxin biosynthesis operon SxtJ-like protein
MTQTSHEVFSRDEKLVTGSDRSFGLVMAAAFAVVTALNAWHIGRLWPWTGGLAALFIAASLLRPAVLNPLNRVWMRFGLLLHKIVNPIIMALLFFGTVWPTGLVMRMMGRDLLRLKREPDAASYWIVRSPPGPSPETMKDQF